MKKLNPKKVSATKKSATKKSVAKKSVAKKSATKRTVAKDIKTKTAPAKQPLAKNVVKKKVSKKYSTAVIAKIDIGFGNELFIRGESGGLSWEKGLPMTCKGIDEWYWESSTVERPTPFKLLINDSEWSIGENETVVPGAILNTTPSF